MLNTPDINDKISVMELDKYELSLKVLEKFEEAGVLKKFVVIGSLCVPLYKEYFSGIDYKGDIDVRGVDFLVPLPLELTRYVDLTEILRDLGFNVAFKGRQGIVAVEHPKLLVDFFVSENVFNEGRPWPFPGIGVNAKILKYHEILINSKINAEVDGINFFMPHPAAFALHKALILQDLHDPKRAEKDKIAAVKVIGALVDSGKIGDINKFFNMFTPELRPKILEGLKMASLETIAQELYSHGNIK